MHIYSKLIEASKTIFDIQLSTVYNWATPLEEYHLIDNTSEEAAIDSEVLYTSGLCIIQTKLAIKKTVIDQFYIEGEHIRYTFFIKGESLVNELLLADSFYLDRGVIRRNYAKTSKWDVEMQKQNSVRYIAILMSKQFFLEILRQEPWIDQDPFIQGVKKDGPLGVKIDDTFPVNMLILKTMQELFDNERASMNRRYFVELKLREFLFILHQQQVTSSVLASAKPFSYKSLESVKIYLSQHYQNPPTIQQLSRMFLINEKKLKYDFKMIYGITLYAFIIRVRMEKAQEMLINCHPVNEIAMVLGYRSVSHFIKTFKTHYGHTPKGLQQEG